MKINKIEIFSYGKWIEQSFFLEDGFNAFIGRNGSGKSTLKSFILSVMFGFPDMRRKGQRQYDTNAHVTFGGRLYLSETIYGDVMLERTRQGSTQQCAWQIGSEPKEEVRDFAPLFSGLTKQEYLNYFGFDEGDLLDVTWSDEEAYTKTLLSTGASGQHVLGEIAPELEAQADEIYRPQGQRPPLNQALAALDEEQNRLKRAKGHEEVYYDLAKDKERLEERLEEWRKEEKNLRNQEIRLQVANQNTDIVEKKQQLGFELARYNFRNLPANFKDQWQALTREIEHLEEELGPDVEAEGDFLVIGSGEESSPTEEPKRSQADHWLYDHSGETGGMLKEAKAYRDKLNQDENLQTYLAEKRYDMKRLLKALGAEKISELPRDLSDEEREHWQQKKAELDNRRVFYENTKSDLEKLLADNQDLQDEHQDVESKFHDFKATVSERTSSWLRTFGVTLFIIGLLLLGVYYVLVHRAFLMGSGFASLGLGLVFAVIGFAQSAYSKRVVKEEMQAYSLDLRDIESEQAEISRRIDLQNEQLEKLQQESAQFMKDLENLVQERGGSPYIEPLVWLEEDYAAYIRALEADIEQALQQTGLAGEQLTYANAWKAYQEAAGLKGAGLTEVMAQFEDDYYRIRDAGTAWQYEERERERQAEATERLRTHYQALKEKQDALLEKYQFASPAEVAPALAQEEEMLAKKAEFDQLAENINPDVEALHDRDVSVDEQLEQVHAELHDLEGAIESLVAELADLDAQLTRIRQSGLVQEEEQAFAEQAAKVYDLGVDWLAHQLAAKALEGATYSEDSDILGRVLEQANDLLTQLSAGRLGELRFEEGKLYVQVEGEKDFTVRQLSRGERVLLYLAMRFAFLEAQMQRNKLPIIIDEAFAHLDAETRRLVYHFLTKMAQDQQIILLTVDEAGFRDLDEVNRYRFNA